MAILALLLSLAIAPLGPASKQNATADRLVGLGPSLGIDFDRENPKSEHPHHEVENAISRSGLGAWSDGEIERGDDTISEPPASVTDFLREHRESIWSVIAVLEKSPPEWEGPRSAGRDSVPNVTWLFPTIRLGRVLVATALFEEREGHAIEAERALEATWSLSRSLSDSMLIHRLVLVAFERWQAGVLRKARAPSLAWMGRLAGGDPYPAMIGAIQHEHEGWSDPSGLASRDDEIWRNVFRSIFETMSKMTPCELSGTTDEEIETTTRAAFGILPSDDEQGAGVLLQIAMPNLVSGVRRAGRLSVDRELTLQILRLRLAKEGSRENRWPGELTNRWSDICPAVAYVFKSDGESMDLQFGADVQPGTERALPLAFHSGKTRLLPTPTPRPTPTPTPPEPEEP